MVRLFRRSDKIVVFVWRIWCAMRSVSSTDYRRTSDSLAWDELLLSLLLYRIRSIYTRSAFAWLTLVACPKYTDFPRGAVNTVWWLGRLRMGERMARNFCVFGVYWSFLGPILFAPYSLCDVYYMRMVRRGPRSGPREFYEILCRNFPCLTEFCIRCASFNGTFRTRWWPFNVTFWFRCGPLNAVQFNCPNCHSRTYSLIGRLLFVIWTHALPIINCMNELRIPYLGMVYLSSIERLPFLHVSFFVFP